MRVIRDSYSMRHTGKFTSVIFVMLVGVLLTGCAAAEGMASDVFNPKPSADGCPLTEPVWLIPPDDAASNDPSGYGYYFVNDDQSILAAARYAKSDESHLRVSEDGIKVGWFRPEGALLEISGRRIDGQADPLKAEIPCCYPTRFQSTGLFFPSAGCWEVNATAADRSISFVVFVEP
jgi:hypothetical protein